MSLGVLNNIAAIYAENNLNSTQNSLQTVLQQLSSGSRINSGADDAAGLSLADGLQADSSALNQSALNAQQGVGLLQVADGALSQVNNLLNRAITLATEASNGTLNATQDAAANQEYQSILAEIGNIGSTTTYNGQAVFNSTTTIYTGDSTTTGGSTDTLGILTLSSANVGDAGGTISTAASASGDVYQSTAAVDPTLTYSGSLYFKQGTAGTTVTVGLNAAGETIAEVAATINAADINGVSALVVGDGTSGTAADGKEYLDITENGANLQTFTGGGSNGTLAKDTAAANITFNAPTTSTGGITYTEGTGENLSTTALTSSSLAETALTDINTAVADVAAQRGYLGSQVNTLNAAANVETTQSTNVVSAENGVTATDYGQASSNLSKYEILSQTGISALAQANSVQQEVLKLLQ
jgi:flagellin